MNEDLQKFPEFEQAIKSIEKLKKTDWPNFANFSDHEKFLKEVEQIIFSEFEIIPNILKPFKPSEFKLPIFRVREVSSFTNIDLFAEHSYPPVNLTKFGRCNFPKNPVFYASDNPMTAISEVVREGDFTKRKFCISRWEIIDKNNFFLFQTFLHTALHPENYYSTLSKDEFERLNEPFKNELDENRIKGLKEYLKFLNGLFINDKKYGLSASLAHRTLYAKNNHATDMLMYPSVQTQYKGVNFAIHPNFVDNGMKVTRFYIAEVECFNKETGKFNITFSKFADIDKNVIMWKDIKPEDELYKKYVLSDFKIMMTPDFKWKFTQAK